jgi:hypothetical protein
MVEASTGLNYERVQIGAAETKWKPNGNIAWSGEPTLNLSS